MRYDVRIGPQSLPYGFQNEIMTIHVQMGIPETIRSNVPNLIKDVPNFVKDEPNFVKDVPRVPKCVLRWESGLSHFLMGCKMKPWTIHGTSFTKFGASDPIASGSPI